MGRRAFHQGILQKLFGGVDMEGETNIELEKRVAIKFTEDGFVVEGLCFADIIAILKGLVPASQCTKILLHLCLYKTISSAEAYSKYGILRLASRVNDLKRRGYNIVGEMKTGNNRFGEKTSFKVYRLAEVENAQTHNNAV
jgi:hypothetical protein